MISASIEELGGAGSLSLTPVSHAVTLDGKLDDELWKTALKLAPFRVLGNVGKPSSLASEALLAIKDDYLYMAYRLEEPKPGEIQATKKDTLSIFGDDCTETFISTDMVSYAHILVNAAGAKYWEQRNIGKPRPRSVPGNGLASFG